MDKTEICIDMLRRLASVSNGAAAIVLGEKAIDAYLKGDAPHRVLLEKLGEAIAKEDTGGKDFWETMQSYVQSLLCDFEPWEPPRPLH
jgi:hypothetical protein